MLKEEGSKEEDRQGVEVKQGSKRRFKTSSKCRQLGRARKWLQRCLVLFLTVALHSSFGLSTEVVTVLFNCFLLTVALQSAFGLSTEVVTALFNCFLLTEVLHSTQRVWTIHGNGYSALLFSFEKKIRIKAAYQSCLLPWT